jgi:charged multivesicular body protein 2A
MMQFEKEGDMMEIKQEVMDDAIDDVMKQEGDEEQEEEILNQVLDEIGINLASDLKDAPSIQHNMAPAQVRAF